MRRRYKVAAVILPILATVILVVWLQRQSIAGYAIDRVLRQNNVPAQYKIVSISTGTQRLADIRIGDPRHPDFHFCGRASAEWLPYCSEHARRAYQPPARRAGERDDQAHRQQLLRRQAMR